MIIQRIHDLLRGRDQHRTRQVSDRIKPEPRYLRAGDVVELAVAGLGQSRQRVVEFSPMVVST